MMQDLHTIAEERIFADSGGGGGTGDRRLRPVHHRSQQHQALKCPRCDSLNTKFCYYNNYNLSQPRHFCKNCRRYWTKGGVLRNVPIGGGCRKTKRSKPKSSAPGEPTAVAAETDISTAAPARERKTNSRSSSESSSLTATTTPAAVEAVSATSSITPSSFFSVTEYKSISAQSVDAAPINHGFEQILPELTYGCGLFSDVENFSNLIASSVEQLPFGFSSVLDQDSYWGHQQDQEQKIQQAGEIPQSNSGVFPEQTIPVDPHALLGRQPGNEEFGPLYWPPGPDQGLSNLPGTVDQAFWSRNSQWADEDHQAGLDLP